MSPRGQAAQFRLDSARPLRHYRMDLLDFPLADVTLVYFAVRFILNILMSRVRVGDSPSSGRPCGRGGAPRRLPATVGSLRPLLSLGVMPRFGARACE